MTGWAASGLCHYRRLQFRFKSDLREPVADKKCVAIRNSCRASDGQLGKVQSMKTPLMLLLTSDPMLEETVAHALLEIGGISHLTCSAGEALEIVCGIGSSLDLAVIDCEHGPYGIRLVSAINSRRCEDVPVIVITGAGDKSVEALAYANSATACLSKPVSAAQIEHAMKQCCRGQRELAFTTNEYERHN